MSLALAQRLVASRRAHRLCRQWECHLYFARWVTFLSCADTAYAEETALAKQRLSASRALRGSRPEFPLSSRAQAHSAGYCRRQGPVRHLRILRTGHCALSPLLPFVRQYLSCLRKPRLPAWCPLVRTQPPRRRGLLSERPNNAKLLLELRPLSPDGGKRRVDCPQDLIFSAPLSNPTAQSNGRPCGDRYLRRSR